MDGTKPDALGQKPLAIGVQRRKRLHDEGDDRQRLCIEYLRAGLVAGPHAPVDFQHDIEQFRRRDQPRCTSPDHVRPFKTSTARKNREMPACLGHEPLRLKR